MKSNFIYGFFILNLLCSITTIWGFFSIYLRNYFYFYKKDLVDSIPQVIICLIFAIWICNLILPYLFLYLNWKIIFTISVIGKCSCYILFFYIKNNWQVYLCSFLINLFESILVFASLYYIVGIFKKEKGKYSGIALSGIGINVLFWSNFITFFTKPSNIIPDDNKIFDIKIANNFYSYVMLYTIINFIFGMVGIYLLKDIDVYMNDNKEDSLLTQNSVLTQKEECISQISEIYEEISLVNFGKASYDDNIELRSRSSNNKKIVKTTEMGTQTETIDSFKVYTEIKSKKFLSIFFIACIRSGFFFYSSSNFKFIALNIYKKWSICIYNKFNIFYFWYNK